MSRTYGRRARLGALAALACLVFSLTGYRVLHGGTPGEERRAAREKERAELAREVDALQGFSRVFRKVAALTRPSVVHIEVKRKVMTAIPEEDPFGGFFPDEAFGKLFKHSFPGQPPAGIQASMGTGVILDEKGAILTNNHVVGSDDAELTVRLHDKRAFKATVKGRDPKADLAVVMLVSPPDDLEPATLGDSDAVEVGDWVIAVGNPFGLDQTVTAGIISAKGRANVGVTEFEDFIQTDAAINPGNSGGPLLNLKGEVIGVNTAIASRTGGYQGIGFTIPINMAREIARQLEENGRVVRGWLGVAIQEVTPELASRYELGDRHGVLVSDVTAGGPAAKAGLRSGDVILSFGDKPVADVQRLRNLVARAGAKTSVRVEVWRDGSTKTLDVELGELPENLAATRRPPEVEERGAPSSLGITARAATPELRRTFGLDDDEKGIVIADVDQGSLAALAGIKPGCVIREIDRKPVGSIKELDEALSKIDPRRGVLLLLKEPGGATRSVLLRRG